MIESKEIEDKDLMQLQKKLDIAFCNMFDRLAEFSAEHSELRCLKEDGN